MTTTAPAASAPRHAAEEPDTPETSRTAGLRATLAGLAWDIGLPVGTYYGLHALGASDTVALLAGTVAAAARIAVVALRTRTVTAFSLLMLGVYGVGLALTFVGGDPHVLLLKDSVGTAVVGVGFLVSLVVGRPMVLESMRNLPTPHTDAIVARYATDPAVRRTVRALTAMWGAGLLVDALIRVPLVYALPISVGVGVSHALGLAMMAVMGLATVLVVRRAQRRDATPAA